MLGGVNGVDGAIKAAIGAGVSTIIAPYIKDIVDQAVAQSGLKGANAKRVSDSLTSSIVLGLLAGGGGSDAATYAGNELKYNYLTAAQADKFMAKAEELREKYKNCKKNVCSDKEKNKILTEVSALLEDVAYIEHQNASQLIEACAGGVDSVGCSEKLAIFDESQTIDSKRKYRFITDRLKYETVADDLVILMAALTGVYLRWDDAENQTDKYLNDTTFGISDNELQKFINSLKEGNVYDQNLAWQNYASIVSKKQREQKELHDKLKYAPYLPLGEGVVAGAIIGGVYVVGAGSATAAATTGSTLYGGIVVSSSETLSGLSAAQWLGAGVVGAGVSYVSIQGENNFTSSIWVNQPLITPDNSDWLRNLGKIPGYTPIQSGPQYITTPDQSGIWQDLTKLPGYLPDTISVQPIITPKPEIQGPTIYHNENSNQTLTGSLLGYPARYNDKDDAETTRGRIRENEAAQILAKGGYDVYQNGIKKDQKNPDYILNSKIFDHYAPKTDNVRNIWSVVQGKVQSEQAPNIVINLADSSVTLEMLENQFNTYPINGLEKVIIIEKSGKIINFK